MSHKICKCLFQVAILFIASPLLFSQSIEEFIKNSSTKKSKNYVDFVNSIPYELMVSNLESSSCLFVKSTKTAQKNKYYNDIAVKQGEMNLLLDEILIEINELAISDSICLQLLKIRI